MTVTAEGTQEADEQLPAARAIDLVGGMVPGGWDEIRQRNHALARRARTLSCEALGVAPPERFSVIRLGVDLDHRITAAEGRRAELRTLFGVPPDAFVVGWIGRMTAIKRVPDVLLSGNHALIESWRHERSRERTPS